MEYDDDNDDDDDNNNNNMEYFYYFVNLNKTINILLLKMVCDPPYFLRVITKITRLRSEFETPGSGFHKVFVTNTLHNPLR